MAVKQIVERITSYTHKWYLLLQACSTGVICSDSTRFSSVIAFSMYKPIELSFFSFYNQLYITRNSKSLGW